MRGSLIMAGMGNGLHLEGKISGTPKPGVIMEISAYFTNGPGRHTWQVFQPGTDGQRRLIAVLLEDRMQGKLYNQAYADGDHCFLYVPKAGEELNMLIQDVAGTGDDHVAGETMIVKSGTGKLIATTGTPQSEPFRLMESATDPIADFWALCQYTGY